jgi:hypothetical protein
MRLLETFGVAVAAGAAALFPGVLVALTYMSMAAVAWLTVLRLRSWDHRARRLGWPVPRWR